MTVPQLEALLNTLPIEITFVDDNNINRFFNEGPKVFKRPQMAIDREVFSCHPPKIEPMVRAILDDFRNNKRDRVPVWMEKNGKPFLVTYMAVRDKKGNYLVPLFATSEVREIAPNGQLLNSVKLSGTPFSSAFLDNGDCLVACGDAHCFVQLNLESNWIVRRVNANDIEGVQLFFVAQLFPLQNGGLYICNWQGHDREAGKGKHPQLVEIDSEGKVVWQLNDKVKFGMISTICPIRE